MSNVKETIAVENIGKFGVLVGGVWYGVKKATNEKNEQIGPDFFEKGKNYDVLIWTSDTGKKYINKVLGQIAAQKPVVSEGVAVVAKSPAVAQVFGNNDPEKQERILRQGVYQAVSQSPALSAFVVKPEDFINYVSLWAEAVIAKVKGI